MQWPRLKTLTSRAVPQQEYTHDAPVYMIFNPYHQEDETYVWDEKMRHEYLENEYGQIFNGWAHDYFKYKVCMIVLVRFSLFQTNPSCYCCVVSLVCFPLPTSACATALLACAAKDPRRTRSTLAAC